MTISTANEGALITMMTKGVYLNASALTKSSANKRIVLDLHRLYELGNQNHAITLTYLIQTLTQVSRITELSILAQADNDEKSSLFYDTFLLLNSLKNKDKIKSLTLNFTDIIENEENPLVPAFNDILLEFTGLESLEYSNLFLPVSTMNKLAKLGEMCSIHTMKLTCQPDFSEDTFFSELVQNNQLTHLSISLANTCFSNHETHAEYNDDILDMARAISENISLRHIDLQIPYMINNKSFNTFLTCLEKNREIRTIILKFTGPSIEADADRERCVKKLFCNHWLKTLVVNDVDFTDIKNPKKDVLFTTFSSSISSDIAAESGSHENDIRYLNSSNIGSRHGLFRQQQPSFEEKQSIGKKMRLL